MRNLLVAQSGGPTAAINATVAGVVSCAVLSGKVDHIYGAVNGIEGVLAEKFLDLGKKLDSAEKISLLMQTPAAALGSCRYKLGDPEENKEDFEEILQIFRRHEIRYFIYIGGNDSMDTVDKMSKYCKENGVDDVFVVGAPKTIDNDVWGTEMTFGFQSAVDIATEVIDCIHTTATSHGRIFIVEVMGHKVGWLNLYAGIAGGADIILLPEIPYDINEIAKVIEKREQAGKRFSILAVAEGAISKEEAKMKKKELKALRASMPYPSISYKIAKELEEVTGHEIRVTVPGHFQRGGSPCAYDRFLCTRFGAAAARLIKNEQYGFMVALQNEKIVPVPLGEVAGKLKKVPVDSDIIEAAKEIGISFGD